MSDLASELQRLADDGARRAQPSAAADVIRRGGRRRRRVIAQQSLGGLSVAGIVAAVVLSGAANGLVPPSSSPAAGSHGANTLTETASTPAGVLTIQVRYAYVRYGNIKLLSAAYSGDLTGTARRPVLMFDFLPVAQPPHSQPQYQGFSFTIRLKPGELRHISGTLPHGDVRMTRGHGGLGQLGEYLTVTLGNVLHSSRTLVAVKPLIQLEMTMVQSLAGEEIGTGTVIIPARR